MNHYSNAESKSVEDLNKVESAPENPAQEGDAQMSSYESRKKNLSKREIMEELSRARFPWDE